MIVADIMTRRVHTCRPNDTLDRAARLMWEHDCGAIPIMDDRVGTLGVVTDSDICMAAYTRGEPLHRIRVTVAGSHRVYSVRPDASVEFVQALMKRHRGHRLPVVDVGGNLVGIMSIADIVRTSQRARRPDGAPCEEEVACTLAEMYRPSGRTRLF